MTTDTKKRIRAYKKALPELRERVVAVALLLAMSVAMMASASFAWLTISRRPEVTGVNTTVAANGNLEIALATSTTAPGESQIGDSSAAEGQSIVGSNVTWGNLVNLSDPSYGLDNLTLRPAQLNQSSLLVSPLYGAVYEGDGRVSMLNSSFAYATWDAEKQLFMVPNSENQLPTMGVRAISSTTLEAVGFAQMVHEKRTAAETANLAAGAAYLEITYNSAYMESLATVIGTYMTAEINANEGDEDLTNPTIAAEDLKNLRGIFNDFINVYDMQFEAMAKLANYQLYLKNNSENSSSSYDDKTAEDMKTTTEAKLKTEGLRITGLDTAKADYQKLCNGRDNMDALIATGGTVKWADSGLNGIVNNLMDTGRCTLDGTPISSIGVSNALGYLDGKTHNAQVTNGVLFNFEKINGTKCEVKNLSVSAKAKRYGITVPATISANITTSATTPFSFPTDLIYSDTLNQGAKGVEVAQDTYGLAIDLWVRTNASGSYLTLEGNVLTQTSYANVTGIDANGNTVDIYTLTRMMPAEDGSTTTETYTLDLYQVQNDDETFTWYNAANHATVTLDDGETPVRKTEEVVTVIGYEGENRIWEDANPWEDGSQLSLDSTTQGSGSCYVYYADTPEDQARSLELLDAFHVAFVDASGTLLATAEMDTERYYAESGRVTVPLVLQSNSLEIGTTSEGDTIYGITALEQNVPKRITAIVYLDGTKLTNQDVLAASDIQGKLNIQFGSSVTLQHAEDEKLLDATRSVSASIDKTSFKYDESLETHTPMTVNVTVNVDGDEPNNVTAFFIRTISATQGSREEPMTFTKQADGSWTASHTFTAPGKYSLRSVDLDGQTYDLRSCPEVTVEGFTVTSLIQDGGNHVGIKTADASYSVPLKLAFASDQVEAMPTTVQGRYLRQDGNAVNVNFTYNASGSNAGFWTGTANFISSGEYTLQYLVMDGEYTELDPNLWRTASVKLGMKVAVYTSSPQSFPFMPSEMTDYQRNLSMSVKIMDDTGTELQGLTGAQLYYAKQGSSVPEQGMHAALTWNASTGYYECTFLSKVGVYYFSYVTEGNNTITSATTSPTFRILSPEPPAYYNHGTVSYQYAPNINAVMNAQITNSSAAQVAAYIVKDGATEGTWVQGVMGSEVTTVPGTSINNWSFRVPTDANGYQDGNWKLTQLKLWDVYAADGTAYTQDYPLILDVSDTNNETKVVNRVFVTFAEGQSKNFGMDADGKVTGTFMQSHTISGLNVDIKDFEGIPLDVSNVQLTFTYSGGSGTCGGYTSTDLTNATPGATVTVALVDHEDGTTNYAQSTDATILYAGNYTTTFSFMLANVEQKYAGDRDDSSANTKALPANAPKFTVWSKAPTVTVTGTKPAPGTTYRVYTVSEPKNTNNMVEGDFFRYTEYSAAVYIYTERKSGWFDQEAAHVYAPEVSLRLWDVPTTGFTSATMSFVTSNSNSQGSTFTFGSDFTAKAPIGRAVDGAHRVTGVRTWPQSYPAGTMRQDKITIVYNDVSYEVTLENEIIINQPQSPPS